MRTREGMAIARAKGRLRGKQPKLSVRQQAHLVQLHQGGKHTIAELAELFSVSRPTVYRVSERARDTSTSLSAGDRDRASVRPAGGPAGRSGLAAVPPRRLDRPPGNNVPRNHS
jgi:DNA invertase Pin-like site-specific DNA recombinase